MLCQSAPINPKNDAACDAMVFAIAWRRLTDGRYCNVVERRAGPVSPYSAPQARDRRLSRRADFDRVFQTGRHNSAGLLAIRSAPNQGPLTRFGYAIPKRVGPAVTRNLVRRRLRESLRLLPVREGFDVVITVRPEAASVTVTRCGRS